MEIALLIGRLIVGIYYLMSAANHFVQLNGLAGYAASKGVPAPKLATLAGGLMLLAGGLTILTGYRPEIGVFALVPFFLPVTFMMHQYLELYRIRWHGWANGLTS